MASEYLRRPGRRRDGTGRGRETRVVGKVWSLRVTTEVRRPETSLPKERKDSVTVVGTGFVLRSLNHESTDSVMSSVIVPSRRSGRCVVPVGYLNTTQLVLVWCTFVSTRIREDMVYQDVSQVQDLGSATGTDNVRRWRKEVTSTPGPLGATGTLVCRLRSSLQYRSPGSHRRRLGVFTARTPPSDVVSLPSRASR